MSKTLRYSAVLNTGHQNHTLFTVLWYYK